MDFIHSKKLHGSTIVLVDLDERKLAVTTNLSRKLPEAGAADYMIESTTDRKSALPGADFVIVSVEINRWPLWHKDLDIPKQFGIDQAQGENGGPGGLFHAMRQIPPIVEICQDVERLCPDALVINLSNPMSRISQAVHDYTNVKYIGWCHEIVDGNKYLSAILGIPRERLHVVAAGINHFTWYQKIQDKQTGEDLYPKVRELVPANVFRDRLLVADLLRLTGLLCVTSDSHAGEYVRGGHIWRADWAPDMEPFDFFGAYQIFLADVDKQMDQLIAGQYPIDDFLNNPTDEVVDEIIETTITGGEKRFDAFNLPNRGQIPNLPADCIVETPAVIKGEEFGGEPVEPLPTIIAEWCRQQTIIHKLNSMAAMEGDWQAALEAMLLDTAVPDRFTAEKCLDTMLAAHREYLSRFHA